MQARKKSDNRINKALTCPNGAAKFKLNQLLVSSGSDLPLKTVRNGLNQKTTFPQVEKGFSPKEENPFSHFKTLRSG